MAAAYLVQVARSSKGGRYRKSSKVDAPEGTFNPLAQAQFGQGGFPEFSQSLLLTTAFEDEDDDEDEDEMPNARRYAPGDNARTKSWKHTAGR
jgi:hypothetical protein